jgi:hypothetical protein
LANTLLEIFVLLKKLKFLFFLLFHTQMEQGALNQLDTQLSNNLKKLFIAVFKDQRLFDESKN